MALIGPAPTVAHVSSLVRSKTGNELFEIFDEVIQFTDGPILTNLAANAASRERLVEYLTPEKLKEVFPDMQTASDPHFNALSWLADKEEALRVPIVELVTGGQAMQKEALTVLSRLLVSGSLDPKNISDDTMNQVLMWTLTLAYEDDILDDIFINDEEVDDDAKPVSGKSISGKSISRKSMANSIRSRLTRRNSASSVATRAAKIGTAAPRGLTPEGNHWQKLAVLVVKACAESHKQTIINYIKKYSGDDEAFAAINASFDVIPDVKDLVWEMEAPDEPSFEFFIMLSSLCNDKDSRMKVAQKFEEDIEIGIEEGSVEAAVVMAKILAGTTSQTGDVDKARERLDKLSENIFEQQVDEISLEGLACTAMLASVRQRISNAALDLERATKLKNKTKAAEVATIDPEFLPEMTAKAAEAAAKEKELRQSNVTLQLVKLVKSNPGPTVYAVVAILAQLAKYPLNPTQAQQEALQLREKSLGKTVFDTELMTEEQKLEAQRHSAAICDIVLSTQVLNWMSMNATKFTLKTREQLAYLLRELSSHQHKHRKTQLATQGAVVMATYLWTENTPARIDARMRTVAAATISKILGAVEPHIALTNKTPKTVVLVPLTEQIMNTEAERQNLDTFEALRALTNLAIIDERPFRVALCKHVWSRLYLALENEVVPIRRSCLELICNIMLVPQSAQHFLQRDPTSKGLLSMLGISIISEDRDSRLAAAGALAILAEWETASEQIGHNAECIEGLSRAMGLYNEDDALLIRVLTALNIILETTTSDMDDEVAERIIFFEGLAHLEELVDTLDPVAHSEVGKLVFSCIKLLVKYKAK